MSDRAVRYAASAALLAGAALALYLLLVRDFYSISWDEAGRTLDAWSWSLSGEPRSHVWLPLYRVLVGISLRIHPDLIWTPRLVTIAFSLAAILAVGWLTHELFADRRATVAALALAAFFPQRIVLGVAPLSSILFGFFVVAGMAFVARWLRTGSLRALHGGVFLVAIAETARFEGWVFGACLAALIWCRLAGRGLGQPLLATALLAAVPMAMTLRFAVQGVNPATVIRKDAETYTPQEILRKNPMVDFVVSNAVTLNLAGAAYALLGPARRRRRHRELLALCAAPLIIVSGGLLATSTVQTGPSWRMIAAWSLLTLPFTSRLAALWSRTPARTAVVAATLGLLFLVELQRIERQSQWAFPEADRLAGAYLARLIDSRPETRIQIEASDFFYLNVVVASQYPGAFEMSPAPGLAPDAPSAWLFQTPESTRRLDASDIVRKAAEFGPWVLYCRPEAECPAP